MPAQDVKYDLIAFDSLPTREGGTTGENERQVQRIKNDETMWTLPFSIAQYSNRTAASAGASNLRRRHGGPDASGFKFECHRITNEETGEERSHLFAVYNPDWVTEEGVLAHKEWLAKDKETKAEQARVRRDAKLADAAKTAPKAKK